MRCKRYSFWGKEAEINPDELLLAKNEGYFLSFSNGGKPFRNIMEPMGLVQRSASDSK